MVKTKKFFDWITIGLFLASLYLLVALLDTLWAVNDQNDSYFKTFDHYNALSYDCLQLADGYTEQYSAVNDVVQKNAPYFKCLNRFSLNKENHNLMGRLLLDAASEKVIFDLKLSDPQESAKINSLINTNYGSVNQTMQLSEYKFSNWNLIGLSIQKSDRNIATNEQIAHHITQAESDLKSFQTHSDKIADYLNFLHDGHKSTEVSFTDFIKH